MVLAGRLSTLDYHSLHCCMDPGDQEAKHPKRSTKFFVLQKQILRQIGQLLSCANAKILQFQGAMSSPLDPVGDLTSEPRYRFALRTQHVPQ